MRMYDIIEQKKRGKELSEEQIRWLIDEYTKGRIPDYQMAAFLMAVYFQDMSNSEMMVMTDAMAKSGDQMDLSSVAGVTADKHSTGGVGDKTTLITGPIAAALGLKVAKMSGRGLGHTGGTIDKLESIPGFRTSLSKAEFFTQIGEVGISIIGQSGNMAPADKKIYALRDVTATVDSIPLIASSVMSKKLAAGSDCIVLDVKWGSGAFMKTAQDAEILAEKMAAIGELAGKKVVALITNMDIPLGRAVGNSLEVMEAIDTLKGKGPDDLTEVCIELAANMLYLGQRVKNGSGEPVEICRNKARAVLEDGSALKKLKEMIEAQGGDSSVIEDKRRFKQPLYRKEFFAEQEGYISHMDTEKCGIVSMLLGAGREKKESSIDYSAGIMLEKKTGDKVKTGEILAVLYSSEEGLFDAAEKKLKEVYTITDKMPDKEPLIYSRIEKCGIKTGSDKVTF